MIIIILQRFNLFQKRMVVVYMTTCYLGIGSNLQTPVRQIHLALESIRQMPKSRIVAISSLYLSKPIGIRAQPMFYNAVVCLETSLSAERLLMHCKGIEQKQGRVVKKRWGSRIIDIDILLYGTKSINTPTLTIPHRELFNRDFVMTPLLEIAPDFPMRFLRKCTTL